MFIGSCAGKFYALDKNTVKTVWAYHTRLYGGPRSFHGDPLLHEEMVVIASDRGCGPEGGYVYAFDQNTGKLRWKFKASGPSTSLVEIGGAIVFGTREDEWLSVDLRSGKLNWIFSATAPDPQCEVRKGPVTDGVNVYFAAHDGAIYALEAKSGRLLWKKTPPARVTTGPFMYKDVLYYGADNNHIYGLKPADGEMLSDLGVPARPDGRFAWTRVGDSEMEYLFAIEKSQDPGVLLAFHDDFDAATWSAKSAEKWSSELPHIWKDLVIAGNCDGEIAAYRARNGELVWRGQAKGCIRSFGHDNETLYIGVQEGTVYAYRPGK